MSLIGSCDSVKDIPKETEVSTKSEPQNNNCLTPSDEPSFIKIDRQEYGFHHAFNYQIENIVADADTITFENYRHKFIFCRANSNWIIEETTDLNSSDEDLLPETTVRLGDRAYQFAVKLNRNTSTAIFELTTPESSQPKQETLYNVEQVRQAKTAVELGEPIISSPVIYGDRIFWSVFAFRGEGFGGIATIVSYDSTTDEISVIQPPEIADQIINDFVITGQPDKPTFWIATQLTEEGNPYLPSMGLVAYHPDASDYGSGKVDSYRVDSSPIVGAIPTKLHLEKDLLWVGTGNGICELKWQAINRDNSWKCWRFALMSKLPNEELPVYRSLLENTAEATIKPDNDKTVEVLWWQPQQYEPVKGRFEIEYEPATIELSDIGATTWEEYYYGDVKPPVWNPPLYWAGDNWHWDGNKFVRGFDEVNANLVGGGARGISMGEPNNDFIFDFRVMRGDLELLELSKNSTEIKYYSAWVDETLLQPYLTIIPHEKPQGSQPNPLLDLHK